MNTNSWQHSLVKKTLSYLISPKKLDYYSTLNWEAAIQEFRNSSVVYPSYYTEVNIHGIPGGYLNSIAPITYDLVTALATLPSESNLRKKVIDTIQGHPLSILDVGCGTGSTTILLKKNFPRSLVIGLDLSPYMLVAANYKARQQDLNIKWFHQLAEDSQFDSCTFDLITIAMLFHEMPAIVSQSVLKEVFRLLKPQGQLIIVDGHQAKLRKMLWLAKLFREPYTEVYVRENLADWLAKIGFQLQLTENVGWIYQIFSATKPT
ncbi:MAG: class I SAM-dependent methyltransferase [Cyanosarcina radialis HA8281-LM2]|jgi:ubiquinone/menaquinone biosynthesis C-methylase UbiE|nr:class I SAM-dependent methyltransferase [Cyanosarcina radialis HA8281-LM2]